jgi:threonine dehydratase
VPRFKRILLKLSGEILAGPKGYGIDEEVLHTLAAEIADVRKSGVEVGIVLGGGNIDPLMMAEIIQRGMVRTGRLSRLLVEIRDIPGSLARVAACVAESQANIEEVRHQRAFTQLAAQNAELELILKTRNRDHVKEIITALKACGFNARAPE